MPLSPARHLGGQRHDRGQPAVVGEIQKIPERPEPQSQDAKSDVSDWQALNALLLLDRVENDIERFQRINQILWPGRSSLAMTFAAAKPRDGLSPKTDGMKPLPSAGARVRQHRTDGGRLRLFTDVFEAHAGGLGRLSKIICEMDAEEESDLLSYLLFDVRVRHPAD